MVQHAQLFLSLFSLLVEDCGELHEFGLRLRFGRLLLVGFFLKLPDLGVQPFDRLFSGGESFAEGDPLAVAFGLSAVEGVLDLAAQEQPRPPRRRWPARAEGTANEKGGP